MRNRYAGPCKDCGETVPVGEGYFEKQRGGGWKTRHVLCVAKAKIAAGLTTGGMSYAQRDALLSQPNTERKGGE